MKKPVLPHRHDTAMRQEILASVDTGAFYKDAGTGNFARITQGETPMTVHYNGPAKRIMEDLIKTGHVAVEPTRQTYAGTRTGYPLKRAPQMR